MIDQLPLPLFGDAFQWHDVPKSDNGRRLTPAERAAAFHQANPQIVIMLERIALNMRRDGRKRLSINFLFEHLRGLHWEATKDEEGFKLNNTYRAWYAREIMERNPELKGFFEVREQRGETSQ